MEIYWHCLWEIHSLIFLAGHGFSNGILLTAVNTIVSRWAFIETSILILQCGLWRQMLAPVWEPVVLTSVKGHLPWMCITRLGPAWMLGWESSLWNDASYFVMSEEWCVLVWRSDLAQFVLWLGGCICVGQTALEHNTTILIETQFPQKRTDLKANSYWLITIRFNGFCFQLVDDFCKFFRSLSVDDCCIYLMSQMFWLDIEDTWYGLVLEAWFHDVNICNWIQNGLCKCFVVFRPLWAEPQFTLCCRIKF